VPHWSRVVFDFPNCCWCIDFGQLDFATSCFHAKTMHGKCFHISFTTMESENTFQLLVVMNSTKLYLLIDATWNNFNQIIRHQRYMFNILQINIVLVGCKNILIMC
jgi:hypothetical protein